MKKKYIVGIVAIILISIIALVGTSFAVFTTTLRGNKKVTIKAGILEVNFSEGDAINLDNVAPVSDSKGQETTPYTFTITNTGNITAYYHVLLKEDAANTLANSYVKMKITGSNGYDSGIVKIGDYGSGTFEIISENELAVDGSVTYNLWIWLDENADNAAQGKIYQSKIVVESFDRPQPSTPSAAETLLAKANPEDLDYNSASSEQQKEMWTFSHPATEQTEALTDYRYIGVDPNNYVSFNNELWRIIGVFTVDDGTGKKEQRLKIIRNESIGTYSWDNKDTTTGAESNNGKNNWPDARLNYLLNPGHESESVGGSLYWNSGSGNCYSGSNNGTTSCDFTTTGLKEEARNMIGDTLWYLGGTANYTSASNGLTSHFYSYERGTNVYSGRSTSWIGKVGLMYPSDYGYATSGGATTNRNACLNKELYNWNSSSFSDCKNNDWLYDSSHIQWALTSRSSYSHNVFHVNNSGYVNSDGAYNRSYGARPVVFLKSNITIASGNGSSSQPYILQS